MIKPDFFNIISEEDVYNTLLTAKGKVKSYDGNPPLPSTFATKITDFPAAFSLMRTKRNTSANLVSQKVKTKDVYLLIVYKFNKYFIYDLNGMINRGPFPVSNGFVAEDRLFYGMTINQTRLPLMDTEAQIIGVSELLINGEAERVALGGAPIKSPTSDEISTWLAGYNFRKEALILLTVTFDIDQNAVTAKKLEGIELYKELRDHLDLLYRDLEDSERRKEMRRWGIIFKSDRQLKEYLYGTITTNGTALDGVSVKIDNTEIVIKNSEDGTYSSHQVPLGIYTIRFIREGYIDVVFENIEIKHNVNNQLNAEMFIRIG